MRYLKKFNESASQEVTIDELVKCDEYLAYLKIVALILTGENAQRHRQL
jgi:hypothetical protein